jgi:hypothetical protein
MSLEYINDFQSIGIIDATIVNDDIMNINDDLMHVNKYTIKKLNDKITITNNLIREYYQDCKNIFMFWILLIFIMLCVITLLQIIIFSII